MKTKLITLVTLAALFGGGLTWTNSAEARPWRGYYGGPAVRAYYGPNYYYRQPYRNYGYYGGYGPAYYGPRYYGPQYYGPTYYSPGVYLGAGPMRF